MKKIILLLFLCLPAFAQNKTATFGWEVTNGVSGDGANVYVSIPSAMTVSVIDVDVSAAPLTLEAAGFSEVLCQGYVSRGTAPTFNTSPHNFVGAAYSSDFGAVQTQSYPGMFIVQNSSVIQDGFMSFVLKTWTNSTGIASGNYRHVTSAQNLQLNAGDYLVFHMDGEGAGLDVEMQVVIGYQLASSILPSIR